MWQSCRWHHKAMRFVDDLAEAAEVANRWAPEHLQVAVAAEAAQGEPSQDEPARPARPLSAAAEATTAGATARGDHAT